MAAPSSVASRPAVFLRLALVLAAIVALVVPASLAGCGGDSCAAGSVQADNDCGKACVAKGGLVENGACVAKCDPTDCLANNTCVNNECQLECTSYKDCQLGTQDCLPAKEDGTGKAIFTCQSSNKAPFATSCPFGTECAALKACPNGDSCNHAQCSNNGECKKDEASMHRRPRTARSASALTARRPAPSPAARRPSASRSPASPRARPTRTRIARSRTARVTRIARRASSAASAATRTTSATARNQTCSMEKGNNTINCGSTRRRRNCLLGQTWPVGHLLRRRRPLHRRPASARRASAPTATPCFSKARSASFATPCLERRLCDPCEVDGQCTRTCPAAPASTSAARSAVRTVGCGIAGQRLPARDYECEAKFCQPRFGKCVLGDGAFCDPCLSDQDCGDKTTRKACVSGSRNQQACEDLAFPKACTGDADCGMNDKGEHLHCWGVPGLPHVYSKLDESMGQRPEGLVVSGTTAYVGLAYTGEIVIYDLTSGTKGHFASGPNLQNGTLGLMLGLAIHPTSKEVYFGVGSFNVAMVQAGIYKVPSAGGPPVLVASDAQMTFPNGLAFDATGNLYVTESASGLIYKVDVTAGTASIWLDDPSLKPNATNCTPNTPIPLGANGIFLEGSGASAPPMVVNTNTNLRPGREDPDQHGRHRRRGGDHRRPRLQHPRRHRRDPQRHHQRHVPRGPQHPKQGRPDHADRHRDHPRERQPAQRSRVARHVRSLDSRKSFPWITNSGLPASGSWRARSSSPKSISTAARRTRSAARSTPCASVRLGHRLPGPRRAGSTGTATAPPAGRRRHGAHRHRNRSPPTSAFLLDINEGAGNQIFCDGYKSCGLPRSRTSPRSSRVAGD